MVTTQGYSALTGGSDKAGEITHEEARNGFVHLFSLTLLKASDGLIDPKLVLAWILNSLGAPGLFIGALVPVREAGALLPQGLIAPRVQAAERRRLFWSAGAAIQGLAAIGIAGAVVAFSGAAAGWAVVVLLGIFSIARAICSVSYKDVLARTIPKTRRGAITGAAGSLGAAAVLAFAAALWAGVIDLSPDALAIAIALGGAGLVIAALVFTRLGEEGDGSDEDDAGQSLVEPLRSDPQLRRFIAARALLVSTALAPPYLLLASGSGSEGGLGSLGPLMIASATASILSSWVWGRVSDRSSRLTLVVAAGFAAVSLGAASAIAAATGGLLGIAGTAAAVFISQIAYRGVRAGRKLHLTDMADDSERARYTAISNTLIGAVLLVGGGFGYLSDLLGPAAVLGVLAVLSALAVPVALGLEEVQSD